MMAQLLTLEGYNAATAANGSEALEYLRHSGDRPQVILLDLMMPVMDGWAVTARMRDESRLATIPVCVVTATPEWAPTSSARVMAKPVDVGALLRLVDDYCSRHPTH